MKRKIRGICILLAMMFSLLLGCKDNTEKTQDQPVKLWYAYNTENIMQDIQYPELMEQRNTTVRFFSRCSKFLFRRCHHPWNIDCNLFIYIR